MKKIIVLLICFMFTFGSTFMLVPAGQVNAEATESGEEVTPDILSLSVQEDGTGQNAVAGGPEIQTQGEITAAEDSETNRNYAQFQAIDGQRYETNLGAYAEDMNAAHTWEVYFRVNERPAAANKQYFVIFEDADNEGWALRCYFSDRSEWYETYTMNFYFNESSAAVVTCPLELQTWYHCVCVFEESGLRVYVNGTEICNKEVTSTPSFDNTTDVTIGGKNDGYKVLNGDILACNLYSSALSKTEVFTLYQQFNKVNFSVQPELNDSITLHYNVEYNPEAYGYGVPEMQFTMNNRTYAVQGSQIASKQSNCVAYTFPFEHLWPQNLADTISAQCTLNDNILCASQYSMKTYCMNKLNDVTSDLALKSLCVALLNYGAEAQIYFDNLDVDSLELANAELTEAQQALLINKTIDQAVGIQEKVTGDAREGYAWNAVTLDLQNTLSFRFKLKADNIDAVSIVCRDVTYTSATHPQAFYKIPGSDNLYYFYYSGIFANEFGRQFSFTMYVEGVGAQTVHYSVNSFISYIAEQDANDTELENICYALYNYGIQAKSYGSLPEADILQFTIDENNAIYNGIEGGSDFYLANAGTQANTTVEQNGNHRFVNFTGVNGSQYRVDGIDLSRASESFTLELYFKYDEMPDPTNSKRNYDAIFCSDVGDLLYYRGDRLLRFMAGSRNSTITFSCEMDLDTWYHFVYVWDGTSAQVYLNSVAMTMQNTLVDFPALSNNHTISVGGKLSDEYRVMDGAVETCNIYSSALTESDIAGLYRTYIVAD